MASIQRRQGTRGTTYRVMWRSPDGRQQSRTVGTLEEARRLCAGMSVAEQQGAAPNRTAGRITFGQWAEEILATKRLKPKTAATYAELLRSRINPRFGHVPLNQVTRSSIREWISCTSDHVSARRTRNAYALLRHLLNEAVNEGVIQKNPAAGLSLPQSCEKAIKPWSTEELSRVAQSCRGYAGLVLWLGVMGTRWAETIGLRWEDISENRVTIASSLSEVRGRFVRVATKTYSTRSLPVPSAILEHLPERRSELIFTSPRGMPLRSGQFRDRHFRPACLAANVRPIRVHDLRHTAASLLSANGTSARAIQVWLGHRDVSQTLSTYLHAFPDELENAAAGLATAVAANLSL